MGARATVPTAIDLHDRSLRVCGDVESLSPGSIRRYLSGEALEVERELAESLIELWRRDTAIRYEPSHR